MTNDGRVRTAAKTALGDVQPGAGQPSHVFRTRCRIQNLGRRSPEPDPQLPDHQLPVSGAVLCGPGLEFGIRFQTQLLLDLRQVRFPDGLRRGNENGRGVGIGLVAAHRPVQQLVNRERMSRTQKTAAHSSPAFGGGASPQQTVHSRREPPRFRRLHPKGDEIAAAYPFGGGAPHSALLRFSPAGFLLPLFSPGPHSTASRTRPASEPLRVTEKGSFFSARS